MIEGSTRRILIAIRINEPVLQIPGTFRAVWTGETDFRCMAVMLGDDILING